MNLRPLSLLLAATLPAQTLTFAEGSPTSLTIATVSEASPNAPDTVVLQAAELLPIEISGRTLGQAGDPTVSRRVDRNGLVRVELPGGGRLFRYRRAGGAFWGFLHVAGDGQARVVLEQPGVGGQLADPFADRIGIAADGQHAAIAMAVGGLWLVRLDGGVYASSNAPARFAAGAATAVESRSLLVGAAVAWFQDGAGGVWRCGLGDGAAPVSVAPSPQPGAFLKAEMVMAGDGSRIVFLYGPQNAWRLWTAGLQGAATVLPPVASKYEEASYLPEGPGEPAMLLNHDGTRLFYVDSLTRDELWLLDIVGALPSLQITEDQIFQPYIGSHILPRFVADKLTVAIGDPAAMDWFRAQLAPTGGGVTNLSATGSALQPFPSGALDPVQATPMGAALLVTEQGAAGLSLRVIDTLSGANGVVQQALAAPPVVGDAVAGAGDVLVPSLLGDRLYDGTGALLGAAPPGVVLTAPTAGPLYSATLLQLPGGWAAAAFRMPDGTWLLGPLEFGLTQLTLTPAGGTVAIGVPVRYLAPGTLLVLNRPATAVRWCLSGAGA